YGSMQSPPGARARSRCFGASASHGTTEMASPTLRARHCLARRLARRLGRNGLSIGLGLVAWSVPALCRAQDAGTAGGPPAKPVAHPSPNPAANPIARALGRLPHDLSPWNMFLEADIVVKAVIVSLAFASIVTWTVLVAKTLELAAARRKLHTGLEVLGA